MPLLHTLTRALEWHFPHNSVMLPFSAGKNAPKAKNGSEGFIQSVSYERRSQPELREGGAALAAGRQHHRQSLPRTCCQERRSLVPSWVFVCSHRTPSFPEALSQEAIRVSLKMQTVFLLPQEVGSHRLDLQPSCSKKKKGEDLVNPVSKRCLFRKSASSFSASLGPFWQMLTLNKAENTVTEQDFQEKGMLRVTFINTNAHLEQFRQTLSLQHRPADEKTLIWNLNWSQGGALLERNHKKVAPGDTWERFYLKVKKIK